MEFEYWTKPVRVLAFQFNSDTLWSETPKWFRIHVSAGILPITVDDENDKEFEYNGMKVPYGTWFVYNPRTNMSWMIFDNHFNTMYTNSARDSQWLKLLAHDFKETENESPVSKEAGNN